MNCPKCDGGMTAVTVGSVEVDRCTACGGLWFDAFEDEEVRRAGGVAAVDTGDVAAGVGQNANGRIDCPKCKTRTIRMVDREQPHIWFESCPVCYGKFFDAGEFTDVSERTLGDIFKGWRSKGRPFS